jgi:hypothetical protein
MASSGTGNPQGASAPGTGCNQASICTASVSVALNYSNLKKEAMTQQTYAICAGKFDIVGVN